MTESQDHWIGRELSGQFRILRPLGRGGMGAVYLAEQLGMDRKVVIKFMHAELSSHPLSVERFRREARAVAQLNHPNVVQVYVAGVAEDGAMYVAMEFVDGRPLTADITPERRFGSRRALHIVGQVCAALGEAHSAGIIHRDLKPDNIMLCIRQQDRDFVKLLDFGIAKLQVREGEDKGLRTEAGLIHGTPRYMSPEQARALPVDARSDLYSLGIILYELLTGANPYGEQTSMSYVFKHATEPVPAPSTLDASLRLAPQLEALLMRCLDKDPARRFGSAEALRRELDAMLRVLPARGDSVPSVAARGATATAPVASARVQWAGTETVESWDEDTAPAAAPRGRNPTAVTLPALRPASAQRPATHAAAPAPAEPPPAAPAGAPVPVAPHTPAEGDAPPAPAAARSRRLWLVRAGVLVAALAAGGMVVALRPPDPLADAPILSAGPDIEGVPAPAGAALSSATEQNVGLETHKLDLRGVLRFYRDRLASCRDVTLEGTGLRIKDPSCPIALVVPMQQGSIAGVSILRNSLVTAPPRRATRGETGAFGVPLMPGMYQMMRTAKTVVYVVDAAATDVIDFYDKHYRGQQGVNVDRPATPQWPTLNVILVAHPGQLATVQVARDSYRPQDPKRAQMTVIAK